MKKIVLFVTVMCLTVYAYAQRPVDKIPYTLTDNFVTGELFAWEPYPYSQDVGFDPLYFTRQSPTHNNSKYALARPVKAQDSNSGRQE